ncbi:MAG: S8 family serine peptidase [Bacteriovoracaceae bacterium]|nr:S8 family serine peptidase [Bacteroidota bacterium]
MKSFLLTFVLFFSIASAQQLVVKANGTVKNIPSTINNIAVASVDERVIPTESLDEDVRLIVEFKTPSRIEQKISGRLFSKTTTEQTKRTVRESITNAEIHREFETIINGLSLTTKRGNISTIASMPDVKAVYVDMIVTASPVNITSSSTIVPQSSTSVATGKGIRIGIIDTGIDYNHEAFGKGMGSGYVIAGGYDIVNSDTDPMDDNGHGTHVAGIICGSSGTISGAAKDASVYIYKALDQNGSGSTSSVIAAIERAINDSVQVLNLSLGTPSGSADDPLSSAVNRAVRAGMVVVVAAGNTSEYTSINSPGMATMALTVGAADGLAIASFSSKGPETQYYGIKPDVVAPGVSVLSAKRGGGYVQMSGTSMAAPYVTALAASMKELHSEWSATQIRDAIISNSRNLGTPLFSQGHGMVDERVLLGTAFASPAQVSFGFDPPASTTWKQQRSFTLYNMSSTGRSYRLASNATNPAIQFRFSPEQTEVPSQGSVEISVELETNNLFLSNNNSFETGYTGSLIAIGSDTITVPFAFIKAPVLQLTFNEIPWVVLIHNKSNYTKTLSPKVNNHSLIIKDGTYDIITSFYGSRYVISENVVVTGKAALIIASTQAVYPVSFQPISEQGVPLNLGTLKGTHSYLEAFVHQPTGFAIVGMGGGKTTTYSNRPKYFSAVSKNYSYGYSMTLQPNNSKSYTYDIIIDTGITSSRSIVFQQQDMKRVDVKYDLASGVQRAFPITWTTYIGKFSSLAVTFYDGNSVPMHFPFAQESYYTQRTSSFPIFHQREAYSY